MAQFYQPELTLPLEIIRKDILRSGMVTLLGTALQIALYIYLQHGGWNVVLPFLHSLSL